MTSFLGSAISMQSDDRGADLPPEGSRSLSTPGGPTPHSKGQNS